jgi:hypothetical protein
MNHGPLNAIPDESRAMILQVLEVNQYDPTAITAISLRETTFQNIRGILAVVSFAPEIHIVILNLPVVVMPVCGKILNLGDVMQLLTIVSEIPSAQFALKDNILFFTLCRPLYTFNQENIPTIFNSMLRGADELRNDLLAAIRHYYQIKPLEEWTYPEPVLPNIKMTPKEIQVIYSILARCNQHVQEVFTLLMENWAKAGNLVATTPSTIVLDAPYGGRTARLAILIPGVSEGLAALQPSGYAQPPIIALPWESLRKYQGIPAESIDIYQKVINKTASLRITESTAHIEMNDQFGTTNARALLKAMRLLAKSVRPELVEEPPTYSPVTPDNIQLTLASCSEHVQAIYMALMESWRMVGGTIQSPRPGRIYLKMETKAHRSGKFAQISRKFNLAVLAGPRGKKPANIEVGWGLSQSKSAAYLDCIPDKVTHFENTVASLPNFERKGTITYLWMNEKFQLPHAQLLIKEMISLKEAEQATL